MAQARRSEKARRNQKLIFSRFAGHRHKAHRRNRALAHLALFFFQKIKLLIAGTAHWNDHSPAFLQLIDQRRRHVIGRARHDHRIEWRVLGPAL